MEDEDGYTALNFRPKVARGRMAQPRTQDSPPCPRWHRITLGLESAGILILVGAVIVMAVWTFQGPCQGKTGAASNVTKASQRSGNGTAWNASLENMISHLKQNLCDPARQSSTERKNNPAPTSFFPASCEEKENSASKCKLCPIDWLSHGTKCYWVSKETKDWNGSLEECSAKSSQMLTIQDRNEMEFIENATQGKSPFWIGLHFTARNGKWTWLNNSSLDDKLFPVAGPAKENSCGVMKGSQISSEICSGEFKRICQKEGVFL